MLVEDRKATRRFVFMELFALSKLAKQERHKIKALELLGKSCGALNPSEQALRYVLVEHLRLHGDARD
jgi:hypothetical protein